MKADDGSDKLGTDVINGIHWMYFGGDTSAHALIDEWVASSKFRPSNPKLITKLFSGVLDRTPFDPDACDAITCPVLIIHGANDVPSPPLVAHDSYHILRNTQREIHVIDDAPHFLSYTHYSTVSFQLPIDVRRFSRSQPGKQTPRGFLGPSHGRRLEGGSLGTPEAIQQHDERNHRELYETANARCLLPHPKTEHPRMNDRTRTHTG